jgi:methylthioribose-1-phosphate isomerase
MNTNTQSKEELDKIDGDADAILLWIRDKMKYLKSSRPTAVNLANALLELDNAMEEAIKKMSSDTTTTTTTTTTKEVLCKVVLDYSEFMCERDVNDNKAIGKFGAEAILKKTGKDKINLVTICNTGSLATAGYGTALGVARSLQKMEKLESISALGMYCMYVWYLIHRRSIVIVFYFFIYVFLTSMFVSSEYLISSTE